MFLDDMYLINIEPTKDNPTQMVTENLHTGLVLWQEVLEVIGGDLKAEKCF